MGTDGKIPEFSRQDLRKATKFIEGDYRGINPRGFYRKLKRGIEEIQGEHGFKYQTTGTQEENLEINEEDVGRRTGTVTGRIQGTSDWEPLGHGELEYRPYGSFGAAGVVLGFLLLILGIGSIEVGALGILLIAGGAYGYMQEETDKFPITRQDAIRVLINGEVSERTVNEDGEKRTDMFADMSVVFAVDAFIRVETAGLDDLDVGFRRELVQEVRRMYNEVNGDPKKQKEVESGFLWQLKGVADRDLTSHRREIDEFQNGLLHGTFEDRIRYTHLLEEQLTTEVKRELEAHEEDLMLEMENLAQNLDIYIEREGYEETDRMEELQERQSRPELESTESRQE